MGTDLAHVKRPRGWAMSGRHRHKAKKNNARAVPIRPAEEPVSESPQQEEPRGVLPHGRRDMKLERVFRKPESVWAVAGVVLAAIVAVIYFLQWRTMIDSVTITRRVSERDERAWVKVMPIGAPIALPNEPLQWTVRVQNIGKTPAREVLAYFLVEVIQNGSEPDFDYSKIRPSMRAFTGIVYPQDTSPDVRVRRLRYKVGSTTEVEDYVLQPSEHGDLTSGRSYIAVHGRVQYADIFHVSHWATFCTALGLAPNGGITAANCSFSGNTADDNDEP